MTQQPKKRGRPKGSKNKPLAGRVVVVPPTCPACGSEAHRVIAGAAPVENATPYAHPTHGLVTRKVIRRRQCDDCGRVFLEESLTLAKPEKQISGELTQG